MNADDPMTGNQLAGIPYISISLVFVFDYSCFSVRVALPANAKT